MGKNLGLLGSRMGLTGGNPPPTKQFGLVRQIPWGILDISREMASGKRQPGDFPGNPPGNLVARPLGEIPGELSGSRGVAIRIPRGFPGCHFTGTQFPRVPISMGIPGKWRSPVASGAGGRLVAADRRFATGHL